MTLVARMTFLVYYIPGNFIFPYRFFLHIKISNVENYTDAKPRQQQNMVLSLLYSDDLCHFYILVGLGTFAVF
jgi:hypothetical protein